MKAKRRVSRRHSTLKPTRDFAGNFPQGKSLELEHRIGRLEEAVKAIREAIELLTNRTITLQAQLDHVTARHRSV